MTILKTGAALVGAVSLAACGGTSTSISFDDVESDVATLQDLYEPAVGNGNFVSPDVLDTSGTAAFSGALAFSNGRASLENALDTSYAISDMAVEIDLDNDLISGEASNFFRVENGASLDGVLDLDGEIFREVDINAEWGIEGTLDGTLEDANGALAIVEMDVLADLYSAENGTESPDFIFGDAVGESRFEGSDETNDVSAIFLVEAD